MSSDGERIKNHLDRVVRGTVEETLNALLYAEADRLCNAQRYERSEARRDTRAGHYERKLQTNAGEVRLKVPKLRQQTFETAVIELLDQWFGPTTAIARSVEMTTQFTSCTSASHMQIGTLAFFSTPRAHAAIRPNDGARPHRPRM